MLGGLRLGQGEDSFRPRNIDLRSCAGRSDSENPGGLDPIRFFPEPVVFPFANEEPATDHSTPRIEFKLLVPMPNERLDVRGMEVDCPSVRLRCPTYRIFPARTTGVPSTLTSAPAREIDPKKSEGLLPPR